MLKKSGVPSDSATEQIVKLGMPLVAAKIKLCKSADGLIRASRPKAPPKVVKTERTDLSATAA